MGLHVLPLVKHIAGDISAGLLGQQSSLPMARRGLFVVDWVFVSTSGRQAPGDLEDLDPTLTYLGTASEYTCQ